MIRFANAKNSGVAKNSSMIVPCMVNSWLYCSGERNCSPGRASSPRISMARKPPTMNQANDVARYIRPMTLWSVVRSRLVSREPFSATAAGLGLLTIGLGAMAVMPDPLAAARRATTSRGAPMVAYPGRQRNGSRRLFEPRGSVGSEPGGQVDRRAVRCVDVRHQPGRLPRPPAAQPALDLPVEAEAEGGRGPAGRAQEGPAPLAPPTQLQPPPAPAAPVPRRWHGLADDRALRSGRGRELRRRGPQPGDELLRGVLLVAGPRNGGQGPGVGRLHGGAQCRGHDPRSGLRRADGASPVPRPPPRAAAPRATARRAVPSLSSWTPLPHPAPTACARSAAR